jgi:hypothetical protein
MNETTNYWYFSKSKGHNSVKNYSIVPKTKLDLDIFMINLYTKFHFSMCSQCKENERRLLVDRQTAAKQDFLPSFEKGGGGIKKMIATFKCIIKNELWNQWACVYSIKHRRHVCSTSRNKHISSSINYVVGNLIFWCLLESQVHEILFKNPCNDSVCFYQVAYFFFGDYFIKLY